MSVNLSELVTATFARRASGYTRPDAPSPSSYRAPSVAVQEAAVVSFSRNRVTNEVERHVEDYEKGRGYLSKETGKKLKGMHHHNSSFFSETSPQLAHAYGSYLTAMSYEQRSRAINQLNGFSQNLNHLNSEQDISRLEQQLQNPPN